MSERGNACATFSGVAENRAIPLFEILERAKGFEPSTPTLARLCSTPELHPHPRPVRPFAGGLYRSSAPPCNLDVALVCARRRSLIVRAARNGGRHAGNHRRSDGFSRPPRHRHDHGRPTRRSSPSRKAGRFAARFPAPTPRICSSRTRRTRSFWSPRSRTRRSTSSISTPGSAPRAASPSASPSSSSRSSGSSPAPSPRSA